MVRLFAVYGVRKLCVGVFLYCFVQAVEVKLAADELSCRSKETSPELSGDGLSVFAGVLPLRTRQNIGTATVVTARTAVGAAVSLLFVSVCFYPSILSMLDSPTVTMI